MKNLNTVWAPGGILSCAPARERTPAGQPREKDRLLREVPDYRKTAAEMTVVQRPSMTPSAAWQV